MKKLFLLGVVLSFFCSCDKKVPDVNKKNSSKYILQEIKRVKYKLNNQSTLSSINSASFFNQKGVVVFSFLNPNDNSLVIYEDAQNPRLVKLEIDGNNGVGKINYFTSFKYINKDSIFIIQNQFAKMHLIDAFGKKIRTYELFDFNDRKNLITYPDNNVLNPIIFYEKQLILSNSFTKYLEDYSGIGTVRKIDITNGKAKNIFELSKKYNYGFWGNLSKYHPSVCFTHKNTLLVSYPIEDKIFEIDLFGKILNEIPCKSKFIKDVKPLNNDKTFGNKQNVDWKGIGNYSLSNSDYATILFDQNNNRYYRIVYLRPNLEEIIKGKRIPNFSIIVLNDRFDKIDEKEFNSSIYSNRLIFTCKEGLAIARKDLYTKDENFITFSIFK